MLSSGVLGTSGSTLVSTKVAGICRVRLPSQLFVKIMWTFKNLGSTLSFQPFLGVADFRYIVDLATKARLPKKFQPLLCSILQGSVSPAIFRISKMPPQNLSKAG